jgi:hypothetical protein
MRDLGELSLEDAAKQAAGNWRDFHCFVWWRKDDLERPEDWAIVYTHNRDSRLLDMSNASAIDESLAPFTKGDNPDVVEEDHSHWAVGWVKGYSIRVYRRGRITEAFRAYHRLAQRMADYPILDEEDYGERELEATLENIGDAAYRLKDEYDLPEGWVGNVYHWFAEHDCNAIENADDNGGYPDEEQLRAAFDALGYQQAAIV